MSTKNYTQEEQIQNINIAIVKVLQNDDLSKTEKAQIWYKLKQDKLKLMQGSNEVKPQNEVRFYEGSYQFKVNKTDLNITEDFITMILAKQYEYRPTQDILWAIVLEENKEVARYSFDYTLGLAKQY
jgi:hypothetical protein